MDMLPSAFIPLECWGWDIDAGGLLVNLNEPGQGGTSGKRGANDAVAIRDLPTAAYAIFLQVKGRVVYWSQAAEWT